MRPLLYKGCIKLWLFGLMQEEYQEALDVLLLAEEAFDMCNPKHLDMVDNVGLLMIDIVWSACILNICTYTLHF